MRRLQLLTFVVPLLAALACNDATAPSNTSGLQIAAARRALVIPSTTAQVSSGIEHTCALNANATVVCWGDNSYGQTAIPAGLGPVAQISVGYWHTCALKTDGTVVCWGGHSGGGLYGESSVPAGLAAVSQVSAGNVFTCALKTDGTVVCWGENSDGQTTVPAGLASVVQVSTGLNHACALKTDGTIVCWGGGTTAGYADYGQAKVPAGLSSITQVDAGWFHTCALKADRTVICWGYDAYGAAAPADLASVTQLSGDGVTQCALKANATVVCWGDNSYGQTDVPNGLASVVQVSAGPVHVCALKSDGSVVCWGYNGYGEATPPAGLNLNVSAPQSISFTSTVPSPAYVGSTYAVTATATSGLLVTFSTSTPGMCSVSGNTVTFTTIGLCTVAADQAGNATHLAAPEQTQSITVVQKPQTITFSSTAPSQPLVGATYAVTATASSGLVVSFTSFTPGTCTMAGSTATFVAAGPCTIAADQAGNATYRAAPEQSQAITVITPAQGIQNLITTITSMGLPQGVANSLSAPLKNINTSNLSAACGKLNAFVNQVNAKVTDPQLTILLQAANAIMASLGCS